MKKGDKITVYMDPITHKCPEGEAVIVQVLESDDIMTQVLVMFKGEKEKYFRVIYN